MYLVVTDRPQAYRAAEDFLEDHEDAESTLEAVLAADEGADAWEFSDVELDSGTFGEVVSAGVVEKEDGAYHVPDRAAVEAALEGEEFETADENSGFEFEFDMDYAKFGGLFGALLVVVAARTFHYRSVFVEGRVVSPGNDPYFFRYWQEQLIAQSSGPFDFSVLVNPPWDDGSFNQRPLTHATNWWFTELLGGDQWAADMVAAFLPLVFTVLLAIVVYYLALVLTRDYRVGVVSVLVLALAPIHANYTGLGLLHHRYNQYFWFGCILLTLAWLGTDVTRRRNAVGAEQAVREHLRSKKTWFVVLAFGLVLAAWTHSWGGSLELFAALGIFVALRVCMDVRDEVSPGKVNLPLVAGFGLGSGLAMALHLGIGWHGLPGPALAVVTFGGVVGVVGLGELWYRKGWSARLFLAVQPVVGVAGLTAVLSSVGAVSRVGERALGYVTPSSISGWQPSTQSETLYAADQFFLFGPVSQIGLEFYIALAMLGWCFVYIYRRYEPAWILVGIVTIHYLIISGIQMRFAGRLVIVMAPLAGLGTVYLLSVLDLVQSPLASQESEHIRTLSVNVNDSESSLLDSFEFRRAGLILGTGLAIFGVSLIFIPTLMNQVTHDRTHVETAMEVSEHSEALNREYPENHVFAPWREYRLYNYFTSGHSKSEAAGRHYYDRIYTWTGISSERIQSWAGIQSIPSESSKGYVVVDATAREVSQDSLYTQLFLNTNSSDTNEITAPENYKLIHANRRADVFVYAIVPGMKIDVNGPQESTLSIRNEIRISKQTYTYSKNITTDEHGNATTTIVYSGEYDINGTRVIVTPRQIENGERTELKV